MESLPKITINTGTAGKADLQRGDSGSSAGGRSFVDLLAEAHAANVAPAVKGASDTGAKGTVNAPSETSNTGGRPTTGNDADQRATPDSSAANTKPTPHRKNTKGSIDTATDGRPTDAAAGPQGTTAGTFAAGIAGAMINTMAASAPSTAAATPLTDAVLGTGASAGAVGVDAKSQSGAQTQAGKQSQAGSQPQTPESSAAATAGSPTGDVGQVQTAANTAGAAADDASAAVNALLKGAKPNNFGDHVRAAGDHVRAAVDTAAGRAAAGTVASAKSGSDQPQTAPATTTPPARAAATVTGASGANLTITPDGDATDPSAAATVANALTGGKSAPGKANSLVTGSTDVVAAKTAIRTGAIDPTTTVKDTKATASGAAPSGSNTATLANGGDGAGSRVSAAPATVSGANAAPSPSDAAAARAQHAADIAKADTAPSDAAALPTDSSTSSGATGTSTNTATVAGADPTSATHHTAASAPARPVAGPVPAAPVFDQIAINVSRATGEGLDHITIQLKPESLGRVDVHLQLGQDGRMSATFVADRQDTLDMLQRDSRGLERALNDAGLRTDSGGLSFNLRGEGQNYAGLARDMQQGPQNNGNSGMTAATEDSTATVTRQERVIKGLLDISV